MIFVDSILDLPPLDTLKSGELGESQKVTP